MDKSGPAILFTHSQGGGPLVYRDEKQGQSHCRFRAVAAVLCSRKKNSPPYAKRVRHAEGEPVPMEQFMALTKIPILIIYGDNIPDKPCSHARTGQLASTAGNGA